GVQNDKSGRVSSNSNSNSSVITTPAKHDNESNPQDKITLQGKLVCHSEGARSATEESLLSTKNSLKESLENLPYCHSERSEEFTNESLVAHRDSSAFTKPQNDKLTAFTKNPNSNSSLLSQARAKKLNSIRVKSRNSHKAKNPT
uniref:hypothetical protein n=1 Tax=Helicobacter marmotae TaxID=152490 RepID=UPI00131518E4